MAERDKGKYKPCSFYVPEKDLELMRFMAAQSNMSLSMRLLMKAFIASNRHETDIDVSMMDLGDLIRSMRVDPELFDDVPKRRRAPRSISAIEAEEIRAQEQAALERSGQGVQYDQSQRSVPGFSQAGTSMDPGTYSSPPAPAPVQVHQPEMGQPSGLSDIPEQPVVQPAEQPAVVSAPPVQEPVPQQAPVQAVQEPAPQQAPVQAAEEPAPQQPSSQGPAAQPEQKQDAGVGEEELDPMAMMGGE